MYRPLIILVAIMLIFYAVVPAVSAGSQTWYFTTENASAPIYIGTPTVNYHKIMKKGVEGGNDKITLAPGERVWFYADELAACDVTFPAGKWNVAYWVNATNSTDSNKTITTRLHGINSTGFRLSGSTGYKSGIYKTQTPGSLEETIESLDAPSFTITGGGRFAVEILWTSGANGNLEIYCNPPDKHASNMTSPSSDPGYPTSPAIEPIPEFTTIAIPIAIVLGLMFLFRPKKRKR